MKINLLKKGAAAGIMLVAALLLSKTGSMRQAEGGPAEPDSGIFGMTETDAEKETVEDSAPKTDMKQDEMAQDLLPGAEPQKIKTDRQDGGKSAQDTAVDAETEKKSAEPAAGDAGEKEQDETVVEHIEGSSLYPPRGEEMLPPWPHPADDSQNAEKTVPGEDAGTDNDKNADVSADTADAADDTEDETGAESAAKTGGADTSAESTAKTGGSGTSEGSSAKTDGSDTSAGSSAKTDGSDTSAFEDTDMPVVPAEEESAETSEPDAGQKGADTEKSAVLELPVLTMEEIEAAVRQR